METRDSLPYSYTALPPAADDNGRRRRPIAVAAVVLSAALLLTVVALSGRPMEAMEITEEEEAAASMRSREPESGMSEKTSGAGWGRLRGDSAFPWSQAMLQWQRTGFHFRPEKNWISDPSGPVYYKGWYHLFYQYNINGAVWGNISWGHAVSRDLVRWRHLPPVMVPDRWYDINGVMTGSAIVLPDGNLAMLYTGYTNEWVQVVCLAVQADPDGDSLLTNWTKYEGNPVLLPPQGFIGPKDFRDPTTTWYDPSDATWRVVMGSKDAHNAGIAITYKTKDFITYELLPSLLHRVPGTGMWECIDIYPVGTRAENGIDMSDAVAGKNGVGAGDVVHIMKASVDDQGRAQNLSPGIAKNGTVVLFSAAGATAFVNRDRKRIGL